MKQMYLVGIYLDENLKTKMFTICCDCPYGHEKIVEKLLIKEVNRIEDKLEESFRGRFEYC